MTPTYTPRFFAGDCDAMLAALEAKVPFESRIEARSECFMGDAGRTYTYGVGRNARTYAPAPFTEEVSKIMSMLYGSYNVCVLNRYADQHQSLGWHSDDSPEQDQTHPIAVMSFGAVRELWTRPIGTKDVTKYRLEPGSLFVMPGGYQQTHQHRIPRHGAQCGLRISLTFRKLDR